MSLAKEQSLEPRPISLHAHTLKSTSTGKHTEVRKLSVQEHPKDIDLLKSDSLTAGE